MELCVMTILLMIPASLAQEDLKGKVFVFPQQTYTDHVTVTPNITEPLQKVSVCLRTYSDPRDPHSLFSLATPRQARALYISEASLSFSVTIDGSSEVFRMVEASYDWRHICVTWDYDTGVIQLWIDGRLYPRMISRKGSSIAAETSIVLGQQQTSFEGYLLSLLPFVGEMSDVHMWDYVLTPREMQQALYSNVQGNIISWNALLYEIKGNILVQPKFHCPIVNFYRAC